MNKGGKSYFHLAGEGTGAQINQVTWLRVISYEMPMPV